MTGPRSKILTAATILMIGSALSRLLGLVREQVIAGLFGPTGTTSAFVTAITVPTMVYDLLIQGAISAALIPVFSDYGGDGSRKELGKIAGTVLVGALILLVPTVAVLELVAPQIVAVMAGGLSAGAQQEALTLVRIVLPAVIFLGISGITTALLYSQQMFTYPAFSVAAYNGGIILLAVLLSSFLGPSSLVLGVVFGAFAQIVLQLPALRRIPISFSLDLRHPALRRITRLYAPVALGLVVSQIGVIIDRNLASHTGEDSIAVMRFATTLIQLPLGLAVTAMSFAILPTLSRHGVIAADSSAGKEAMDSYKRTLVMGIRLALIAIIPAAVGLVLLRTPIIRLLFEHGVFGAYGTERTALAFLFYAPQLPFVAVDQLLIFAFYARKNTMTPMLVGVLGVAAYLASGLSLMGPMGLAGLALANTIQNSLHAVVLFVLLQKAIGSLAGYGLMRTLAKSAASALVMAAAYYALNPFFVAYFDVGSLQGEASYLFGIALVCAIAYGATLSLLRAEEATFWLHALRSKLGYKPT
ncbi:MAG: murein biosynthesis integral membrane protein MurJ [Chloroflexi bacterium]|nr:murein biosynthesis integral membrane protein MurJ [Chloroflexota bacterium]